MIRRERAGDEAVVHRIQDLAFSSGRNNPQGPAAEATLVDLLRADPDAWLPRLSLVAEVAGEPVGHVVCTRAKLAGTIPVLGLGPIGVLPEHQRAGVGTALVHAVCAAADALDEALVVLLGDPVYYVRTGFVLAGRFRITPPVPEWAQHFQARPLTGYDRQIHHGAFSYAAPFALVS